MTKNKIIVTGGAGYVGSILVPQLLYSGYTVEVVDKLFFGNHLPNHPKLTIINKDIRDVQELQGDIVIHLASIPNDPSAELNPEETWDINVLGTRNIIEKAIKGKVRKFIYASSGSVYGISTIDNVTEYNELIPISIYNKTKMIAEELVYNRSCEIDAVILRPATICGFSPRMRNDLTVNMLTWQALVNKKITVFGGDQIRPNISIFDMVEIYKMFVENHYAGIFNAGFENLSVLEIARKVRNKLPTTQIEVIDKIKDARSYRLDSSKLLNLGYKQMYTIDDMIDDLIVRYNKRDWVEDPRWNSVETLKGQLCKAR
jgi:nucleoside-diphosphate-sugar epimerase